MSYDEVVASVRMEVQKGLSVEGAVVALRNAGLTITQSMKALTEIFGMSLGDAKSATAGHSVWAEVAKAAEPLHDQLEAIAKAAMKRVIATIRLTRTEEGGRRQPLLPRPFGCPVFFENVPELQAHGYDCRMLLAEHGEPIAPGETVGEIALLFLSADEVLPHMKPGVRFSLWDGRTIGSGTVVRVEDAP